MAGAHLDHRTMRLHIHCHPHHRIVQHQRLNPHALRPARFDARLALAMTRDGWPAHFHLIHWTRSYTALVLVALVLFLALTTSSPAG